jgi:hypothetical protein
LRFLQSFNKSVRILRARPKVAAPCKMRSDLSANWKMRNLVGIKPAQEQPEIGQKAQSCEGRRRQSSPHFTTT